MKIWLDDKVEAPEGYVWAKSVHEAISLVYLSDKNVCTALKMAQDVYGQSCEDLRNSYLMQAKEWEIELIDTDFEAGEYARNGGNYLNFLYWLADAKRKHPVRIHAEPSIGVDLMRGIIRRNGWTEVKD